VSDLNSIIDADDLENLKRQLAYTFLDAYGNFDGAGILFDAIVKATEKRIIKLLDEYSHIEGVALAMALIEGEQK